MDQAANELDNWITLLADAVLEAAEAQGYVSPDPTKKAI
jgi:hypothetical protein